VTAGEWLAAKARYYFEDARRLAAMPDDLAGMSGEQWATVYRAVAAELSKCAEEAA